MTDQTQSQPMTPLSEISRLKDLLAEVIDALKNQREILRVRGISLPPMTLQTLEGLGEDLTRLERVLVNEQTELGQLRSLARNTASINATFDLNDVLNNAMDVVITLTGAERGYIILVNPETHALEFRIRRENEVGSGRAQPAQQPQISQTIVREVLESGEPLLTDNAYKDERLQGNQSIAALTLRSVLCVPLRYKDQTLGVVYVDNRLRSGVFEQRERNLLAAFANQVAVAIVNAQLYTEIQRAVQEITAVKELTDNVFESIGSGVITTDAQSKVLTFNRAAALILARHDRENVIHQRLSDVLPGLPISVDELIDGVQASDEKQVIETELIAGERGRVFTSIKLSPLKDAHNVTQGMAMVIDDLTEQHERDEILAIMRRYLPPQMVDNIHTISGLDLGGEKREVTCIFVDAHPLSVFPEGTPPQAIMEIVNVYLGSATECIHQVEGVIDKYMGTEIMGLFNTQLNPQTAHAAQAVEAALRIRDAFTDLYAQIGIRPDPHYYRIGIHTGVATLGNVGSFIRRDFTAIGDTINLSKRLQENAGGGQIIISEDVRQQIAQNAPAYLPQLRLQELEPIQVKGRQQKTRIYEVFRR